MSIIRDEPAAGVRRILIDRPAARNAIDGETRASLLAEITDAAADTNVRTILLGGAGGLFSAGGDLPSLVGLDRAAAHARLRDGHRIVKALWSFPKPVVAAVERFAVGAAAGLALLADEIVIGRSAFLAFPFARLGLVPDWGLAANLTRRAGPVAAARLLRTGAQVRGEETLALGLADRVAEDDAVMREALAAASALADSAPEAFARLKRMMRGDAETALNLAAEADAQADCIVSAEFAEGFAAFREKRAPRF